MLILKILGAIALINAIVAIHEAGHLIAAKRCGLPVSVFSIGFGKPLVGRTFRGVRYQLGAIPLGGFVRIDSPDEPEDQAVGFYGRTNARGIIAVTLSGVVANFVLAYATLYAAHLAAGRNFLESFLQAGWSLWKLIQFMLADLPSVIYNTIAHPGSDQGLSGPIGAAHILTQSQSLVIVLLLASIISLSIAVFNLLPLPFLDGGHCLLGLYQHIRGRALKPTDPPPGKYGQPRLCGDTGHLRYQRRRAQALHLAGRHHQAYSRPEPPSPTEIPRA